MCSSDLQEQSRTVQHRLTQLALGLGVVAALGAYFSAGTITVVAALTSFHVLGMVNSLSDHTTSRGVVFNITWVGVYWSEGR